MNRDPIDAAIGSALAIFIIMIAFYMVRALWRLFKRGVQSARTIKAEDVARTAGRAAAATERKAGALRDAFKAGRGD